MMTPSELREYEFKAAGRNAYKSDDVDNFFGEVAVAYEKLFRENAEYTKRLSLLADRLEQFKNDEDLIKQAVISAQKAADIIVKEAEDSVADSKTEAEAILAAAKGEADIIKSDAEKQAIADSDLLLSIARDKAEEIINKAKEEAHAILLDANKAAEDTVGAANRTITSESILFEMLKKEVSDFRASVLSQYKAHIELISQLPELAIEQAQQVEAEAAADEAADDIVEEIESIDPENDIIEYIETDYDNTDDVVEFPAEEEENDGEMVVKTTLPFDFFQEETPLEFVENEVNEASEEPSDIIDFNEKLEDNSADIEFINEEDEPSEANDDSELVLNDDAVENDVEAIVDQSEDDIPEESDTEDDTEACADIPISKGFSVNTASVSEDIDVFSDSNKEKRNPMFDSFGTIDDDEEDEDDSEEEEPKKRFGFFRKKNK